MKKLLAVVLVVAMLVVGLTACTNNSPENDLANIQKAGKIVVGITDYAPMDYKENGEWTGFDAEFAKLVAAKLGVEVEFIEIDWDNKFFELESGTIDCIWNGMTLTDDVKNNTSYSTPYVKNAQVVVMAADKVGNYTDFESMKGLTFAVEKGSAGDLELQALGAENVVQVDYQSTALMEVAAGSADACVIDITMANAMIGEGTSYANLAYSLELSSEVYVIGFREGSSLTDKVNAIIDELYADGTLTALAEKYELTLAF